LIPSTKASGRAARRLLPWKCREAFRLIFLAGLALLEGLAAWADGSALYRVDQAGLGSCYDADTSLMLAGHVFAYLQPGAVEVSFPHPPAGVSSREEVILLGDATGDFSARASRYIMESVLGKDVLLAFDADLRSPSGALLAYVYRQEDGTCVNFTLVRRGLAHVAPPEISFEFRSEFEMYERQAMARQWGIWRDTLGVHRSAGLLAVP
jgi:hypothetical protein